MGLDDPKAISIILQLADKAFKHPYAVVEDMLINVWDNLFLADFIILDIVIQHMPLILRRPFLVTSRALMNFEKGELFWRIEEKQQCFTMNAPLKQPLDIEVCQKIGHLESNKNGKEEVGIVG